MAYFIFEKFVFQSFVARIVTGVLEQLAIFLHFS